MFVKRDFKGKEDFYKWEGVAAETYTQEELTGVSKQVMVGAEEKAGFAVRYYHFKKGSKGDMTRHDKAYCFYILHGRGELRVNEEVYELTPRSVVYIPAKELIQVIPKGNAAFGFLCVTET